MALLDKRSLRDALIAAAALSLGWWAHSSSPVHAAAASVDLPFQFSSITPATALTLYNPNDHMLYVYQAATTGNSHVNCSYRFRISSSGQTIDRENCPSGSLYP